MKFDDKLGPEGDVVYSALMKTHEGLSETESHELNARLILMLMNEVGDADRLRHIFEAARKIR